MNNHSFPCLANPHVSFKNPKKCIDLGDDLPTAYVDLPMANLPSLAENSSFVCVRVCVCVCVCVSIFNTLLVAQLLKHLPTMQETWV